MKTNLYEMLSIIYDTLLQNTENPQFDLGESSCEVVNYGDGTIEFEYGGESFILTLKYKPI